MNENLSDYENPEWRGCHTGVLEATEVLTAWVTLVLQLGAEEGLARGRVFRQRPQPGQNRCTVGKRKAFVRKSKKVGLTGVAGE
jgi:hypothetical protein